MIHERSTALERSVKSILLEGLNLFHGANLNLIISSDVDPFLTRNNCREYIRTE